MRVDTMPGTARLRCGVAVGCLLTAMTVGLLCYGASPARAQSPTVLFSQSPDYPGPFGAWTSSTPLSGFFTQGSQTFDDFVLTQTSLVTTIQWQGLYIDLSTPANNPVAANTALWGISFATDAGGFPGTTTTLIFSPLAVTQSFVGQGSIAGSTVNVYNYSLTMATPFIAQAGTRYWFSPISIQPSGSNTLWAWNTGAGGAFGNGVSRQYGFSPGGASLIGTRTDMAFTLIGAAAPEPASLALLSLAVAAGGWTHRTQRRRRLQRSDPNARAGGRMA